MHALSSRISRCLPHSLLPVEELQKLRTAIQSPRTIGRDDQRRVVEERQDKAAKVKRGAPQINQLFLDLASASTKCTPVGPNKIALRSVSSSAELHDADIPSRRPVRSRQSRSRGRGALPTQAASLTSRLPRSNPHRIMSCRAQTQ